MKLFLLEKMPICRKQNFLYKHEFQPNFHWESRCRAEVLVSTRGMHVAVRVNGYVHGLLRVCSAHAHPFSSRCVTEWPCSIPMLTRKPVFVEPEGRRAVLSWLHTGDELIQCLDNCSCGSFQVSLLPGSCEPF